MAVILSDAQMAIIKKALRNADTYGLSLARQALESLTEQSLEKRVKERFKGLDNYVDEDEIRTMSFNLNQMEQGLNGAQAIEVMLEHVTPGAYSPQVYSEAYRRREKGERKFTLPNTDETKKRRGSDEEME